VIPATLKWIFLFAILALPATAAEGWSAIDGDTVRTPAGVTVRLANIDAPETGERCRCQAECRMGEAAKAFAAASVRGAGVVELRPYPRPIDRYGRTLAYVLVDGRDLGEALIGAGLARKWTGRREPWCSPTGPDQRPGIGQDREQG
jgi:micrococcal nuclease